MTIAADSRQSEAHEIIITRIFDAPRELMFARWWGPKGFTNPSAK
jgi:uncharacterized protein YndB with AHSA1/START domain